MNARDKRHSARDGREGARGAAARGGASASGASPNGSARARARGQAQKQRGGAHSKTGRVPAAAASSARRAPNAGLDEGLRDDLTGLALVVVGIVLFVAVVAPADAPVTAAISSGLHLGLGLGAYLFPVAFLAWGLFFFMKTAETRALRLVAGILVVIVAVMGLLALWQPPVHDGDPMSLFAADALRGGGGYAGASVAWLLMAPFGRVIATIVLAGFGVAGLVLAGLSISDALSRVRDFFTLGREEKKIRREKASFSSGAHGADAAAACDFEQLDLEQARECQPEGDETLLFGNKLRRRGGAAKAGGTRVLKREGRDGAAQEAADAVYEGEVYESTPFDEDVANAEGANGETVNLAGENGADGTRKSGRRGRTGTKRMPDATSASPSTAGTPAAQGGAHEAVEEAAEDAGASATKKSAGQAAPTSATVKPAQGAADDEAYSLPPAGILKVCGKRRSSAPAELQEVADELQQTLEDFGVPARVVGWTAGPTVTVFKIELPRGTRMSTLVNLADDIALSLAASGVRIAQIPRTSLVGVEIPNKHRETVYLGDVIGQAGDSPLSMAIGEDVDGNKICLDLAKMPHLLVAGTTGSGKSVALNGMITTMLMRTTPDQVRMIMVDPKRVEFKPYEGIPHLYVPPVTDPKEAASALKWAVAEMERRLKVFEQVGARNIAGYNKMVADGKLDDEETGRPDEISYIVVIIDELTDLMMVAGKEVEDSIVRISQLARAVGIHLIIATQSPKSSVVTGMIKANITNRMACTVATNVESRVIIDQSGAEKLTGNGDMLFVRPEWGKPKRIQGVYVSEAEVEAVVEHLKSQGEAVYHTDILKTALAGASGGGAGAGSAGSDGDGDPLVWQAAEAVVNAGLGSTSMLQRRLKVGYSRAGRIMDELEELGVVGPGRGSKARDVLIESVEDLDELRAMAGAEE